MDFFFSFFSLKRLGVFLLVLGVSGIINYFFSFSTGYWLPITALLVLFTSTGSAVFQGLMGYIVISVLVFVYSWFFSSHAQIYTRMYDIAIGAVIGIFMNILVFPKKSDVEFRKAVLPILNAYENYFTALVEIFLGKEVTYIESQQIEVENKLQHFPTWIYSRGFDLGLQTGYRYFSGKMLHAAEILFAMHFALQHKPDRRLIKKIKEPLLIVITRLQYLFKAMITVFELNKISEGVEDCLSEIYEMETKLHDNMPQTLALIDLPPDYLAIYEFVYCLKDLRHTLIKLAQALR